MIELFDVGKYYPTEFGKHWVFRHVTLKLGLDKSVAVIGPNGAGKSTFLRILGGADIPSEGRITRHGNISPPMGLTPTLQPTLSGTENARFAGRIYGLTRDQIDDMIDDVRETADIGKYFDMPVSTYSAGMRQRVAFSINISLHFDFYLFDEISAGGDREFRKFSKARVKERLQTSKFIVASHNYDDLLDLCDAAIVVQNGELRYFEDIQEALTVYDVDSESDGEDDPKARRRARRKARQESQSADGLAAVPGDGTSEDTESGSGQKDSDRAAVRERRLARLRALSETDEPSDNGQNAEETAEEKGKRQRIRELREQLRALRRETGDDDAADSDERTEPIAAKAEPEPVAAAMPEAAVEQVSPTSPAETSGAPAEAEPAAAEADEEAEADQSIHRRRPLAERREKRRARFAAADAEMDRETAAAPPEGEQARTDDPSAEDVAETSGGGRRRERRERRRRRDQDGLAAADRAEPAEDQPSDAEADGNAAATPPSHAGVRLPSSEDDASTQDAIGRLRALAATPDDWRVPPDGPAPPDADDGNMRRAVFLQQRAQAKSARAMRLLLQHLEQPAEGEDNPLPRRRLGVIAAAQEIAASEAATARAALDSGEDGTSPTFDPQTAINAPRLRRRAARNMTTTLTDSD